MSDPMLNVQPPTGPRLPSATSVLPPARNDPGLDSATRLWLRRLPAGRRPLHLCALHPHLARRLAACWADPAAREQVLDDLLVDRRGGREGFPASVVAELERLRDFGAQQSQQPPGPPWWRAMVKAV